MTTVPCGGSIEHGNLLLTSRQGQVLVDLTALTTRRVPFSCVRVPAKCIITVRTAGFVPFLRQKVARRASPYNSTLVPATDRLSA